MSRTPLFQLLRRAVKRAHAINQMTGVANDERLGLLLDQVASRRAVLKAGVYSGIGLAGGALLSGCGSRRKEPLAERPIRETGPSIAIVGGGLAGLTCAHYLRKAGLGSTIYEASARTGGRVLSARGRVLDNWTQELGGEFFDSTHEDIFRLTEEFGLTLEDRFESRGQGLRSDAYHFEGVLQDEAALVEALRPLVVRMAADNDSLGEVVDFLNPGGAERLDQLSITDYLGRIGASGVIRQLIEVAYTIEYGLDANEQSALNLLFLTNLDAEAYSLYGESDERYRIEGGNQKLPDALASRLEDRIERSMLLESVTEDAAGRYQLSFLRSNGTSWQVAADFVVLALPFTMLREVRLDLPMPEIKRRVIRDLGYGANSKLLLGFTTRPWERAGYVGDGYTEQAIQAFWNNANAFSGAGGSLTIYTGGSIARALKSVSPETEIDDSLSALERIFPGSRAAFSDRATRMHWPSYPFVRASYSAYRVGQWTTLAGAEALSVGRVAFAGEHCSSEFQGYMNGAVESGRIAAETIATQVMQAG